jgi:hypothetical protein
MRMGTFMLGASIMTSKSMDKDSTGLKMEWSVKASSKAMNFCMER